MDFCTDYALKQIAEWERMAKDYPNESAVCERIIQGWKGFIDRTSNTSNRHPDVVGGSREEA